VSVRSVAASGPGRGRSLHRFANPGHFLRVSRALLPWFTAGAVLLTAVGLTWPLGAYRLAARWTPLFRLLGSPLPRI